MSQEWLKRNQRNFRNFGVSLTEAIIVLFFTMLPLMLGLISHIIGNVGTGLSFKTVIFVFSETFTPGDVFGYVAGILGSTMAFFIVNIYLIRYRPRTFIILIIAPLIILFFTVPIYIQDADGQAGNITFLSNYIIFLLVASLSVWIFSLYQSRALFEIASNTDPSNGIISTLDPSP